MADISFNEPQYRSSLRPERGSFLTKLAIRTGLAKDEAGAQRALLIAAIVIAALAVGVYLYLNPSQTPLPENDPSLSV